MTDSHEHTPNTPPDTFSDDIAAAKEGIADAEKVLRETDHTEELRGEIAELDRQEALEKSTETLRALFSQDFLYEDTPLPNPPIPAEFLIPAIEQLMDEGVFWTTEDDFFHTDFLTHLLTQSSAAEGVRDFYIKVPKIYEAIGNELPAPLSLTIEGNCGSYTGNCMQGGTLTVQGDCGESTGNGMKGGTLTVEGNCGQATGRFMKGGTITVEGNCGNDTGMAMEGGVLTVHGDVAGWSKGMSSPFRPENTGKVIHKGVTLWDNGLTPDTPKQ